MTVERNKTKDNKSIQEYRIKQGEKCGYIGIGLNIVLFAIKLIVKGKSKIHIKSLYLFAFIFAR